MRKVSPDDLLDLTAYERERDRLLREVIGLKETRRVALGDRISLLFENTRTVLSQVQEMVRAERIVDPVKIQFEIDTYNALIPRPGELSATLFIEITRAADVRRELDAFLGMDRPGALRFDIQGAGHADARFEAGYSTEERISAVQYVRFPFDERQRAAFVEGRSEVALILDHQHCRARAALADRVRRALAEDLTA